MSWDPYVDMLLTPKNGIIIIDHVVIIGKESKTVWAKTKDCCITDDEINSLTGDRSKFGSSGPTIEGRKCRLLRDNLDEEDGTLKLKTAPDDQGVTRNICVGQSHKTLIYVRGCENSQAGDINIKMGEVTSYLKGCGY